jgi:exodeoxyribonuclease VII large subunit
MQDVVLGVSDFVALVNQTFEYSFNSVVITGELANFKVSKNRWVYFDLKDEQASVRFFGTVYMLPGPLEDGMMLEVLGTPRLHPQFGFSVTVASMRPVGEGSIKKAASLLQAKLEAEGLFDVERKRELSYPPERIGLVTSRESAAYADFMKILDARWRGLDIEFVDTHVQGEQAPEQIVAAIQRLNQLPYPPEVLVLIRGGGSADDLQAFSTEQVVRAVASSRIPTLVAIGHEIDTSLAELAADQHASTPSNAAELLVPDRRVVLERLEATKKILVQAATQRIDACRQYAEDSRDALHQTMVRLLDREQQTITAKSQLLAALNPSLALQRGFAIIRNEQGAMLKNAQSLETGAIVHIEMADATVNAKVEKVRRK